MEIGIVELTYFVMFFSVIILLPGQLLLCFKVKSLIIRLLPVIVFTLLTAVNVCLAYAAGDWDAIAYLAIGVLTLIMLAACGIGWGVWGISRLFRRKK